MDDKNIAKSGVITVRDVFERMAEGRLPSSATCRAVGNKPAIRWSKFVNGYFKLYVWATYCTPTGDRGLFSTVRDDGYSMSDDISDMDAAAYVPIFQGQYKETYEALLAESEEGE